MKKILKSSSIFSGIFMATLSVLTGHLSVAQDSSADPNLAVAPSAAASDTMQAAPIELKTPAASGPAGLPEATAPKAAVLKVVPATELTDSEFNTYSFAFKNISGAGVDKFESPTVNSRWRKPLKLDRVEMYVSNDQNQFLDFFGPYTDGSAEVVTVNKIEGQATLTSFIAKKPVSYTVVNKRGEYTATPGFCKLLAFQTNSKNFAELGERAVTCKAFYDKTNFDESMKTAMQSTLQNHRDIHRRNLKSLQKSTAKPMIDEIAKKAGMNNEFKRVVKSQSWIRDLAGQFGYDIKPNEDPLKTILPRNVLTAVGSPKEVEDRAVLFDLAEACGHLWKDSETNLPSGPAKPGTGAATSR